MYRIYADSRLIHDDTIDGVTVTQGKLEQEIGKSGVVEFEVYPDNPAFDSVFPMANVMVERDGLTVYIGRCLHITYGLYGQKRVSCEGELAFLLDSLIEPHTYSGSFVGYLAHIVGKHNALVDSSRRFVVGTATVAEYAPYTVTEKEYRTAFDLLNGRMVGPSGGYLQVRYSGGERYLDLLAYEVDVSNIAAQDIEFGVNVLDIKREFKGVDMFSAIVPMGAKLANSEKRLDIKAVNSNVPYIVNETARQACKGLIYRQVVFDNITNASTLKTVATSYLADNYAGESTIEITAADVGGTYRIGQWVRIVNAPQFGYSTQLVLIRKTSVDLLNAGQSKITVGHTQKGLTDDIAEIADSVSAISVPDAVQPYVIRSGTTGIWTWKVFSDNTCEFFGKVPVLSASITGAFGTWYRGEVLYDATAYEYPVTMTEAPAVEMTYVTRNGLGALCWVYSQDADTAQKYLPQCYLIRPTTATGSHGNLNVFAKGKAKE